MDTTAFLREIIILELLGEIDLTPDPNLLDEETLKTCREMSDIGMVIGGSVLLKACGLIDRDHGDIDVIWDIEQAKEEGIITKDNIINDWKEYGVVQRYKVKISEVTLDIFQETMDEHPKKIEGIMWADPIYVMKMKFSYFRDKDKSDFYSIRDKVNEIINKDLVLIEP